MKKTKLVFTEDDEKVIEKAVSLTRIGKEKEVSLRERIKIILKYFKKEYPKPCFPDTQKNKESRQSLKKISDTTKSLLAYLKDENVHFLDFIKFAWPSPTNPLMDRVGYSEIEILTTRELLLKLQISTSSALHYLLPPKSKNGHEGKHSNHIFLFFIAHVWLDSNPTNKVTAYIDSNKNKFIDFLNALYGIVYPDIKQNWERPIKEFVRSRKKLGTPVSQTKRS